MGIKFRYQELRQRLKSRTSRQPVPNLSCLPPEILRLIFSQICPHCTRPADLELSDSEDGKLTFKNLCLTCQRLRPLAQSFLFHSLWLRFGLRGFRASKDGRNFELLRTLIQYPDLAASVQRIIMGGSEMVCQPARLELIQKAEGMITFRTRPVRSRLEDEVMFTRLTRDLFVSLARNLTELSFPLGFRRGEHRATDLADALSIAKHEENSGGCGDLSSLRTLTLFPERGTDFVINDPRIRTFLRAAPNLSRLVIDQVADAVELESGDLDPNPSAAHGPVDAVLDDLPIMRNLKAIHLQHCMITDDTTGENLARLQRLVSIAPNLRRFQFSAGFNKEFHVLAGSRVLDMLEPFYTTLVDLGLHYNAVMPYLEHHSVNLQGLIQFQRLRVLRLDEAAFCDHQHSAGHFATHNEITGFQNPEQPNCLTKILPLSVQILHLKLMHGCEEQYDALQFALHVASGQFMNLLHIQIESTMHAPPHGAMQVRSQEDLYDGGHLRLPRAEADVVIAFLEANIKVWIRDTGWFDDWDVGTLLKLVS